MTKAIFPKSSSWSAPSIGGSRSSAKTRPTRKAPKPPNFCKNWQTTSRGLTGSPVYKEYQAICGWLDEFDGMAELSEDAQDYQIRIGVDRFPANGEEYLRALIGFAKETFGSP